MSYQVLARKWRPRSFAEMVGQEHVVRALSNALDKDRLHHAYLFTGTRGVGKTTLARILSKSLNCETGVSSTPCGECSVCREIDEGRFVDLLEVDAASKTGVDDTRELLVNVPYAPVRGRYKVYLIDEVHMFSGHSFNALLKTLEEPPAHVKFLLATTDPQKVPVTVLSRCLQFSLKRLPLEQIEGQFRRILESEGAGFEPSALQLLGRAADGSMRDGLSLLDQALAFGAGELKAADVRAMLGVVASERLPALIAAAQRGDASGVMQEIATMAEHAPDFGGLLRDLIALLHRLAVVQQVPEAAQSGWETHGQLTELAQSIPPEELQLFYQIALVGQRDLPLAPDARSGFEMVMLRMLAFRPDAGDATVDAQSAGRVGTDCPVERESSRPSANARSAVAGEVAPSGVTGAEAVAPVDVPAAMPVAADPSDWHAFVGRLKLKGMAAQLADNCQFEAWDGRELRLLLDPNCSGLVGSLAEQRLGEALSNALECPVRLSLVPETAVQETPARRAANKREQRQSAIEADIASDPVVLGAQEKFDAEIVPDSIRETE